MTLEPRGENKEAGWLFIVTNFEFLQDKDKSFPLPAFLVTFPGFLSIRWNRINRLSGLTSLLTPILCYATTSRLLFVTSVRTPFTLSSTCLALPLAWHHAW